MIRIKEELVKSIFSLQREPNFHRLTQLLEEEYETCITGLIAASKDKMQPLQGRAQVLSELIALFKHNQ